MKVKELIEALLDLPMDGEIYIDTPQRFVQIEGVQRYGGYLDKRCTLVLDAAVVREKDIPVMSDDVKAELVEIAADALNLTTLTCRKDESADDAAVDLRSKIGALLARAA